MNTEQIVNFLYNLMIEDYIKKEDCVYYLKIAGIHPQLAEAYATIAYELIGFENENK